MTKKKIVLFVALPILLLTAGFVAKTMLLAPTPPDETALAKKPGPIYAMAEPFTVNLADRDESPHFAKVGVALRFSMLSAPEIVPAKGTALAHVETDAELRDIVIATIQRRSSAELSEPAGRAEVKRQIIETVNSQTDLKILDVYYTEFAVQ